MALADGWKIWTLKGPSFLASKANHASGQDQVIEALNVTFASDAVLQMRQGFDDSIAINAAALAGSTKWIGRHIANDGAEEGWVASDDAGTPNLARSISGGTYNAVTFSDTVNANGLPFIQTTTQNGKLYFCYDSNVNRLHVWDGTSVRRVGLGIATAPTVATLGGAGLNFTRYYRQRNTVQVSGVTVRRSEPSTSATITLVDDSGVQVTKGAVSGENETHWEVEYADAAAGPWYRAATVVVGTTTYDDTAATISTTTLTDTEGLYVPPPAAKYILTDGGVLLMAGAWESSAATGQTSPFHNRVWFTRPLGSTDISDDESITQTTDLKNWIDVGDPGPITGLAGPLYGDVIVFKSKSIWKLVPTGNLNAPYSKVCIHPGMGAIDQVAIVNGTLKGIPAIFFANSRGVWALTAGGFQLISDGFFTDIEKDSMRAPDLANNTRHARMAYDDDEQQVWLRALAFNAVGVNVANYLRVFDTERLGWSGVGLSMTSVDVPMLRGDTISNRFTVVGSTTTGRVLNKRADAASDGYVGKDLTAAYTASVTIRKPFAAQEGCKVTVGNPTIWYRSFGASSDVFTATVSYRVDFGDTRSASVLLQRVSAEPLNNYGVYQATLEGLEASDVSLLDLTVSIVIDSGATAVDKQFTPAIDVVQVPYLVQEPLPR